MYFSCCKNGVVNIDWNKGNGADKYIIYRKTSENGKWVKIATVSDNQYTDTQPVAKHDNYYTVRSYYSKQRLMAHIINMAWKYM